MATGISKAKCTLLRRDFRYQKVWSGRRINHLHDGADHVDDADQEHVVNEAGSGATDQYHEADPEDLVPTAVICLDFNKFKNELRHYLLCS